jgi:opacity protein-like surface antigen
LRKFALLSCSVILFLATFAFAQQGDIMVGGGTLLSPRSNSASVVPPPTEKGGVYVNIAADLVKFKHRTGFNVETAWRYHQTGYGDTNETYRPILTDFNALFQPQIRKKIGLDLFAGIGIASTRFNVPSATTCSVPESGCTFYTSNNHFMEDLGGGVRYYVWHRLDHVFVRPEIHYYHIQNNGAFSSPNVFRAGVSIGYTIGHAD